ncbi:MAG: response regulator transcription factor [Actinobacteria bacterium]|nr:response regulator transcription factor [Actinomycetota bacterium]
MRDRPPPRPRRATSVLGRVAIVVGLAVFFYALMAIGGGLLAGPAFLLVYEIADLRRRLGAASDANTALRRHNDALSRRVREMRARVNATEAASAVERRLVALASRDLHRLLSQVTEHLTRVLAATEDDAPRAGRRELESALQAAGRLFENFRELPLTDGPGPYPGPLRRTGAPDGGDPAAEVGDTPRPATTRPAVHPRDRVLVVEDDPVVARLLTVVLDGGGFAVEHVTDGWDALHSMEAVRPAAVLLDLGLPHLDGLSVLRSVRARPDLADLPVVVVTVRSPEAGGALVLEAGASDYLVKPVDPDELLTVVRAALRKAGDGPAVPSAPRRSVAAASGRGR